ncbi:MAG: IclR family transcriptional regulator [Thermoleophilia bacterium]
MAVAEGGERGDAGSMQVITRAAAVLGALAEAGGALNLAQLTAGTGLPKTTVHRLCRALEAVGYVAVDKASGRRELGRGLLRLAVIGRRDFPTVLEPYLAGLSDALNETVDLAVLDGGRVLFLAQHPAPHRELMAIARVGEHFPASSMASGKVLLARLPGDELRRRLPRGPEPSPTGGAKPRAALLAELDEIRATGLGYEREELRHGICAVAVAVTDVDGAAASIAVPMPASRFEDSQLRVAEALLSLRDEIQQTLRGGGGAGGGAG